MKFFFNEDEALQARAEFEEWPLPEDTSLTYAKIYPTLMKKINTKVSVELLEDEEPEEEEKYEAKM